MWTNKNTLDQLVEGVLRHGPEILKFCETQEDVSQYLQRLEQEKLNYPIPPVQIDTSNWLIPNKYKSLDIEQFCLDMCETQEQLDRVNEELALYRKNNMISILQAIKYVIDVFRENKIVWGVGRGSSVASYVLFLIGCHKIDSIKYKLPIEEFFKGDTNG